MQLKPKAIAEIKAALSLHYERAFSDQEAEEIGKKLITLYEAILRTNSEGEE